MHISIWEKLIVWWTAVDAQQQRIVHEKMHKATKKAFTWPRQNFEKPTLLKKVTTTANRNTNHKNLSFF